MRGDAFYLRLAARLAWRGFGRVAPNPMVGCVIVSGSGEVVGLGHHGVFGGLHAEAEALASCARRGVDPRGATAFVTLEPCGHVGKQPACAAALVGAGVSRVVAAVRDPGELSGGGFDRLREAGVVCEVVPEASAVRVGAGFVTRVTGGRPFVTCKWAQTVDGYAATRGGDSKWISGERSRALVHRLRGRVDAVVVGSGTARADDPMLTARGVGVRRSAVRVVIDSGATLGVESKLARSAREGAVVVVCAESAAVGANAAALRGAGVEVVGVNERAGRVDLWAALEYLARERGVQELLCEAGPRLTGALVREGLADELVVFTAPLVLGDPGARAAVDAEREATLGDGAGWRLGLVRRVGEDVMSVYSREAPRV